jgi:hypothetical protein
VMFWAKKVQGRDPTAVRVCVCVQSVMKYPSNFGTVF